MYEEEVGHHLFYGEFTHYVVAGPVDDGCISFLSISVDEESLSQQLALDGFSCNQLGLVLRPPLLIIVTGLKST